MNKIPGHARSLFTTPPPPPYKGGGNLTQQPPPPTPPSSPNPTSSGKFNHASGDKVAKIFNYAGFDNHIKLHTGVPGTMINTCYEIEPLYLTCHLPSLPGNDTEFMFYRFGVDIITGRDKRENVILWDISQYNFNGNMIYVVQFKNGQVSELVVESTTASLDLELYVMDLRDGSKFPINSYADKKYPLSISIRVYNDCFIEKI